jgi:hypothetical protein
MTVVVTTLEYSTGKVGSGFARIDCPFNLLDPFLRSK